MKIISSLLPSWLGPIIFFSSSVFISGCVELPTLTSTPDPVSSTSNISRSQPAGEKIKVNLVLQETAKAYRTSQPAVSSQVALRPVDKAASSSRGKEILCTPAVLRPGETLIIQTSRPFPQVGVFQPKNGYLALVSDDYPEGLADYKVFQQLKTLEIRSDAKVKPNRPVFTLPGVYTFAVSTNLETDDGTPRYECKVNFRAK